MADDQEVEPDYEYFMRNRVHELGKINIDFHDDPENVECICTRVLLNSKPPAKRKHQPNLFLFPRVDQITFPAPQILSHPLAKNNGICNNVNEITVDSPVDNSDENHLISDTEETTSCCSFGKLVRALHKKVKRRKKNNTPVNATKQIEETVSNEPTLPETCAEAVTVTDIVNEGTLSDFDSKLPANGITHLGFAFEEPQITIMGRISWEYDVNRMNRWNASLTLQKATQPAVTPGPVDSGDAEPKDYRTPFDLVENFDTEEVSTQSKPAKRAKHKKKEKTTVLDPVISDPLMISTTSNSKQSPASDRPWRQAQSMPPEIATDYKMKKYWHGRYRLFSKYDLGIRLDRESWYSVTPEKVAEHIADRCRCDVIVDGFCGAGGNSIQFAFTCERVIAIDIDPEKIAMAKHNASIYGVDDRIEFINGDFFEVLPELKEKVDVVFLSPPWGGLEYNAKKSFPLKDIRPKGGKDIFDVARRLTENVAYFLPRNINTADLFPICKPDRVFELEQNFLTNKLVAVTAYFGELPIQQQ